MKKQEIYEMVTKRIGEKLGADYNCDVMEVVKVNLTLDGLLIHHSNETVTPTIYLNSYVDEVEQGRSIESVVDEILEIYRENQHQMDDVDFNDCMQLDKIVDSIVVRVINTERNLELLQRIPHMEMDGLGLSCVCFAELKTSSTAIAGFYVTNKHLKMWNITDSQLMEKAITNTNQRHHFIVRRMQDILMETMSEEMAIELGFADDDELNMYVLTDETMQSGASALCMEAVDSIKQFAMAADSDVYILPSSKHELIMIRADFPNMEAEYLQKMVKEVNEAEVSAEDFLSDDVFFYSLSEDKLVRV